MTAPKRTPKPRKYSNKNIGTPLGPWLVTRGALLMCLLMVLICLPVSTNASISQANGAAGKVAGSTASVAEAPALQDADCAVSDRFPAEVRQWCSLIQDYAGRNQLEPDLVAALIWQESGGNPTAYSHSGAVGLMQIMPRDGLAANFMCKNGPCFASRPTIAELQEPRFNVEYGTRMLAGLLTRTGSLREALRSYGPMDVGYSYADTVLTLFETYRTR